MADVEQGSALPSEGAAPVVDGVNATLSNGTDSVNATARFVSTPEGTALAYGSLVVMALLPIFFGALRSVNCSKAKVTPAGRELRPLPDGCTNR